ncbi:MAG TPA: sensor histidine kinase [Firmicutes bacterium]|nr:sensor histidine kinase [Bacillota bacterium]HHY99004.1 sensor histidine kinase [Bacillota bacterium]
MRELSLHVLDIAQNSLEAGATYIEVTVHEDRISDRLTITIKDNGRGMPPDLLVKVKNPFVTTRQTRKVGLGLSLLAAACEASDGRLDISSGLGAGTVVVATFRLSHIDRAPLGDMASTIVALLACNPGLRVRYEHILVASPGRSGCAGDEYRKFIFDSDALVRLLENVPVSNPRVLCAVREMIEEGIAHMYQEEHQDAGNG